MAKKEVIKNLSKNDERKVLAFLAVFLLVVGFLIALLVKRRDKYVMFYAKQGLILFFAFIIIGAIGYVLKIIPYIGEFIYQILIALLIILWIVGLIYSLSNKEKEIPFIGRYARMLDF